MRIPAPNYTQTPNDLFDKWLPLLKEGELKVLMVIMRKTFGWHKERDRISLSQLQKFTGLSETTVLTSIKLLEEKGLIIKETVGEIGKQLTFYELVVEDSNSLYPPKIQGGPPQNLGRTPPKSGDTKETLTKETLQKKQQQQAVAVFSEKPQRQQTPLSEPPFLPKTKIYECLKNVNPELIPTEVQHSASQKFSEEVVENALKTTEFNRSKIKTTYVAYFLMACEKGLKPPPPKLSVYEEINHKFKNGEKYNGAECILNSQAVCFERGMKHEELVLDKFFTWDRFDALCKSFGINFNRTPGLA